MPIELVEFKNLLTGREKKLTLKVRTTISVSWFPGDFPTQEEWNKFLEAVTEDERYRTHIFIDYLYDSKKHIVEEIAKKVGNGKLKIQMEVKP